MPIYEYQCQSCGYQLEKLQKVSDERLVDCPACGKPELVKKISAAGFRLKGGGWYETDFKTSSNKKNIHGDAKSASGGSSTETKSKSQGNGTKSETGSQSAKSGQA